MWAQEDARAPAQAWAAIIQQLLEQNLQQEQVNQELAEELQNLRLALAVAIPIPNPSHEALRLLTKLGADEDVEAFLTTFERLARRQQWSMGSWSHALVPLLTAEAQPAY